jgi:hypothetical protein
MLKKSFYWVLKDIRNYVRQYKYTSEDRNNGSIVDTIGFAIVETEPKNAAERIAAT